MNITVEYIEMNALIPHEDIDTSNLIKVAEQFKVTIRIKPIIADKNTFIIIDGHHRFNVLKNLGYKKIPVILVDYYSPEINVNKWYHKIPYNSLSIAVLDKFFSNEGDICIRIYNKEVCESTLYNLLWRLESYEKFLSTRLNLNVQKTPNKDGIEPPDISKEDVIRITEEGKVFPPKTTRHTYKFFIPEISLSIR